MVYYIYTNTSILNQNKFYFLSSYSAYLDCKVIAIPARYDIKPYAYGFQKDSPYLDVFNFHFKKLKENGVYDQIVMKYKPRPQVCPDFSGQPLGFGSCISLFLIILAGHVFGLSLMLIECILIFLNPKLTWFSSLPSEEQLLRIKNEDQEFKIRYLEHRLRQRTVK